MQKYFKPDYLFSSISEVPYAELAKKGIKVFVHDIDNTLTLQGEAKLSEAVAAKLKEAAGLGMVVIATNNSKERSSMFPFPAKVFKPKSFWHWLYFRKPFNNYYDTLLRIAGVAPNQMVMIGDKYFFDINPAKKRGMLGVLINPIGKDLWGDSLMGIRKKENKVLLNKFGLKRPE